MVQWLRLCASTAGATGSMIPDWGTKFPQGTWQGQNKNKNKKKTSGSITQSSGIYSVPLCAVTAVGAVRKSRTHNS